MAYVTRDPDRRNAYHPSVSVLSDREWLVTFDLGSSTEALDYHTRALRSEDAGATWSDLGALLTRPDSMPTTHTIRTRHIGHGRVLGLGKWEDRSCFMTQRSNRETLGQVPMRLFWLESRDGGRQWSAPHWIEPPLVGPTWELCHPPLVLQDGRWIAPVATWRGWNGELPNGEITGLLVSADTGENWPMFIPTFDGRKTGRIHWEQSVVVRSDGSLLATAWVYDPRQRLTEPSSFVVSAAGRLEFSTPRPTGFLAQTCKILELRSGRIMAAYRRHDRPGLWVELARVDTAEWRTERRGLIWAGAESGMAGRASTSEELNKLRFGYPSLAELSDGSVLVVFWGTEGERTAIHWCRFVPGTLPAVS